MSEMNYSAITPPPFKAPASEIRAYAIMEMLSGKSPSLELSPTDRQHADALVLAIRQGNKARVLQLSADYYQQLLSPAALQAAYQILRSQAQGTNPDFELVMDALRDKEAIRGQSQSATNSVKLTLEEALVQILLTITQSDKNSISYHRLDDVTGKLRPTTFPLTEQLIQHFLAPFGDQSALIKGLLIFTRGQVIGNPAAIFARRCRARLVAHRKQLAQYEQQQQKLEQERAQRITPGPKPAIPAPAINAVKPPQIQSKSSLQEVRFVSQELEKLLKGGRDRAEQQALAESLQPEQLVMLAELASQPQTTQSSQDFGKTLESIYAKHLSRQQSAFLSARLSSRMKRMLSQMGDWKDEYWSEFQTLMIENGVWEGSEWLEKWRAGKKGKQHLAKTGKDYLVPEKITTLDDMLEQAKKMENKQRGQNMLSPVSGGWTRPERPRAAPEQRRLLSALARPDRLLELIEMAISSETWQSTPAALQQRLYEVFYVLSDTDLDTIKQQFLAGVEPEHHETAKTLISVLELKSNQMMTLFRQDPRLSYRDALEILISRQVETERREKMNSQAWQQTPAAQYARYHQA